MHAKFNKKKAKASPSPIDKPTGRGAAKLQSAVSDVMKLNQESKNDRKAKIPADSDAIEKRLGDKMRSLFADAALKVKQRKKAEETSQQEQGPETNSNKMITLELQQKEISQDKAQF